METDVGFISFEIEQLTLGLTVMPIKDPSIRLDLSIENGYGIFQFVSTGNEKFSTDIVKSILKSRDNEVSENEIKQNIYIAGFNNLLPRTTFIDLNSEVMNGLSNSTLIIKVLSINDKPAEQAAPVKGGKGAPVVETTPAEEVLIQISLPFHTLLSAKNSSISLYKNINELFSESPFDVQLGNSINQNLASSDSAISMKVFADNALAEYVLGSNIIYWSSACLNNPSAITWGLQAPDVVDPKAKVPPTAIELRNKYIDNISNKIKTQDKVAKYTLAIGGELVDDDSDTSSISAMFSKLDLSQGIIAFSETLAKEIAVTDDIRACDGLWSITWSKSPVIFIHRSQVRTLTMTLLQSTSNKSLPVTIKKTPLSDMVAVEGTEQVLTTQIDLSIIRSTGTTVATIKSKDFDFSSEIRLSYPLLPVLAVDQLSDQNKTHLITNGAGGSNLPQNILSSKKVSSKDPNIDILKDLRMEISGVIERIAREYVSLYPESTKNNKNNNKVAAINSHVVTEDHIPFPNNNNNNIEANLSQSKEERKNEFILYLTSHGIFHELKNGLKPKVLLLIRNNYGSRGRALGRSETLSKIDLNNNTNISSSDNTIPQDAITKGSIDAILSELYVFLSKECCFILNSMFTDTIIDRDVSELENVAVYINDEKETKSQTILKLLNQADDAFASFSFEKASFLHLERIQIINHCPALGPNVTVLHDAYAAYGEFLLQQAAILLSESSFLVDIDDQSYHIKKVQDLISEAREALYSAYQIKPDSWKIGLLYAGVLIEQEQYDQAEVILLEVIRTQIQSPSLLSPLGVAAVLNHHDNNQVSKEFSLESFSQFDGYDSDGLCPIDPMCYSVLAALFSLQGHHLRARKALLMANRSFIEGKIYKPDIYLHGTPRRTIVLTLSQTGIYLFQYAMIRLGQACVKLALNSEAAVTAKALARGKSCTTVPHIKHLLKRLQSLSAIYADNSLELIPNIQIKEKLSQALQYATDSQLVSEDPADELQGWIMIAKIQKLSNADALLIMDAFLKSVGISKKLTITRLKYERPVPLEVFIHVSRYLLQYGRYNQARLTLLYACTIYTSATLFMQLGACLLRLDELQDAEDALIEANLLDNRHPEIWSYLSLLCLSRGPHRMIEAEKSLDQSLRLGLSDAAILRELATSFMSIDKLQTAEDLIRRALYKEIQLNNKNINKYNSNARTRKLLADILASQNKAVKAVEEYQKIIADESVDIKVKLEVSERCSELLLSLGREEELNTLKQIIATILQQNNDDINHERVMM